MDAEAVDRGESRAQPGAAAWSRIAALFVLALMGGTWIWWALKHGAYFGTVLYPGALLLAVGAAVLVWSAPWRASLALSGPARLALFALVGLATWSLASALWSPTPDIAVADAQRIFTYALSFGLGIWGCTLLGRRMELSMAPLAGAGLVVGVVVAVALATAGDPARYLDLDGTLEYPLGYRNATAAFFGIALWPAIALASSTRLPAALRVAAFATSTLAIEIVLIAQSRGSIIGAAAGAGVFVFALGGRGRLHGLAFLAMAALPALPCLPAGSALFDAAKASAELTGTGDEMNSAGALALAGFGAAIPLGFLALRLDRLRLPAVPTRPLLAAIATAGAVFLIAGAGWIGDRFDEFRAGEPDLAQESTRFTFNAGSNRSDVWRVALEAAADDPVFGEGGGGFQFRYNRDRTEVSQLARDAHSIWLEHLSELGVVGLALLVAALGGAFSGAVVSRRLGPSAVQLSCGAMAAGAYWLAHSSVDWFWPFPALCAPVLALLGAAAAPALILPGRERSTRRGRGLLLGVLAVFAISVVPPFLSERLTDRAFDSFRAHTEQAYDDLALAQTLNPLSDQPWLAEGAIAQALGETGRAIDAYREAARKRPEEYAAHAFLALALARSDPGLARQELAVAAELNPLAPFLDRVRRAIRRAEARPANRR